MLPASVCEAFLQQKARIVLLWAPRADLEELVMLEAVDLPLNDIVVTLLLPQSLEDFLKSVNMDDLLSSHRSASRGPSAAC